MNNDSGLIGKIYDWAFHPVYSDESAMFWTAGLAAVLILSFMWSQVVNNFQ